MIASFFMFAIIAVFGFILSPLPVVEVLPWGVDEFMVMAIGYFRVFADFFPPFVTLLNALLIYLAYRIAIIILRFFLGSRTPTHV